MQISNSIIFDGLNSGIIDEILRRSRSAHFEINEFICRQDESGDSLFIIQKGLVEVLINHPDGMVPVGRLRKGDVVGEMSLITGEPRTANVVARIPTDVLEIKQDDFLQLLSNYPDLWSNICHILINRQKVSNIKLLNERKRGEAVTVLAGVGAEDFVSNVIEAGQFFSPENLAVVDLTNSLSVPQTEISELSISATLESLDSMLANNRTVVIVTRSKHENLEFLLENMDRIILIAYENEVKSVVKSHGNLSVQMEVFVVVKDEAGEQVNAEKFHSVCVSDLNKKSDHVLYTGRHLSRTKIGLALGAGGAKGYAHIGVLKAMEESGFCIDYIGGSSIGAIISCFKAMGMDSVAIEKTMKKIFSKENVKELFTLSLEGLSLGQEKILKELEEIIGNTKFSDLSTNLIIMAADLNSRAPVAITDGLLIEAIKGATALPGLTLPYEKDDYLLVDALALVPVPVEAIRKKGSDITISVNLMSRETLDAWPGDEPQEKVGKKRNFRMLDTLIETLDMLQLDTSVKNAQAADIIITPEFGPSTWKDFNLDDKFKASGYKAAKEQIHNINRLVKPMTS